MFASADNLNVNFLPALSLIMDPVSIARAVPTLGTFIKDAIVVSQRFSIRPATQLDLITIMT